MWSFKCKQLNHMTDMTHAWVLYGAPPLAGLCVLHISSVTFIALLHFYHLIKSSWPHLASGFQFYAFTHMSPHITARITSLFVNPGEPYWLQMLRCFKVLVTLLFRTTHWKMMRVNVFQAECGCTIGGMSYITPCWLRPVDV